MHAVLAGGGYGGVGVGGFPLCAPANCFFAYICCHVFADVFEADVVTAVLSTSGFSDA